MSESATNLASAAGAGRPDELAQVAERLNFSAEAVSVMDAALRRGNFRMAQFDHPEFGGHGQWLGGGMLMIGDMFNHALKARVAELCDELAKLRAPAKGEPGISWEPLSERTRDKGWWPAELGSPDSAGGQNDLRYAYFARSHRLALDRGGQISVYDTGEHQIGGVAQQQSDSSSLRFSSQLGTVEIADFTPVTD